MKVKKKAKLKSEGRIQYYKTFGWLGPIAYRLRGDLVIRKFLETGKYIKTYGPAYQLIDDFWVQDIFITSTVKRSRIKNVRDGCLCVSEPNKGKDDD